jgi:hypothetical protein
LLVSCHHHGAKSAKCFDDIRKMVKGRTAAEVQQILGKPDSQQKMLLSAERWIWWNYTFLDGQDYPPELRGRLVHLEIIFERAGGEGDAGNAKPSDLRAADPLSVTYTLAEEKK